MTTALLKDTARLFTCAAADIGFLRCMIFSNFSNFQICMYFRNFEILHEFHESIFRHASRERARLRAVLRSYGGLYGGPEWPVFASVPLAAE